MTPEQLAQTQTLLAQGDQLGQQASQQTGIAYTPTSPVTILSSQQGQTINQQNENQLSNLNQYVVKPGDTLSKIATSQGVQTSDISGFKSGDPNLIYPGEVLSFGGGTPATQSMVQDVNNAAKSGVTDPAKLAELQKAEADVKTALAAAETAKNQNDPNALDYWMKKANDMVESYKQGLQDYLKSTADLRAQRAALAVPGAKEMELTKQAASIKTEIDQIKVANEKSKFQEFRGQTNAFAVGRGNEKDVYTNFQLMERGIALNGVLAELGIETAQRGASLDSVKAQLSDLKDDYTLQTQITDKISSLEDSIVARAQQLSTQSQNQLSSMLDLLKGVNPSDLTSDMQIKLQGLAQSAGIPIDLITQALKTQYQRETFDNALKLAQEQRLEQQAKNGGSLTEAERKAQAVAGFHQAFVPNAAWNGQQILGSDGYIDPNVWKAAIADAPSEGLSRKDFITEFGYLINPKDLKGGGKDYGLTEPEVALITG